MVRGGRAGWSELECFGFHDDSHVDQYSNYDCDHSGVQDSGIDQVVSAVMPIIFPIDYASLNARYGTANVRWLSRENGFRSFYQGQEKKYGQAYCGEPQAETRRNSCNLELVYAEPETCDRGVEQESRDRLSRPPVIVLEVGHPATIAHASVFPVVMVRNPESNEKKCSNCYKHCIGSYRLVVYVQRL